MLACHYIGKLLKITIITGYHLPQVYLAIRRNYAETLFGSNKKAQFTASLTKLVETLPHMFGIGCFMIMVLITCEM